MEAIGPGAVVVVLVALFGGLIYLKLTERSRWMALPQAQRPLFNPQSVSRFDCEVIEQPHCPSRDGFCLFCGKII